MNINLNNKCITGKHIMIAVSVISTITTVCLICLKVLDKQISIDINAIVFSIIISISSLYLIKK